MAYINDEFCDLKSNMDRFIAELNLLLNQIHHTLKSNMDRFIVCYASLLFPLYPPLKSNMDRFIELSDEYEKDQLHAFKIQYG